MQTLAEYREKYALYHSDPDLQALRASHPLVAIWDDHEVEDNWAADQPGAATPDAERRVAFAERRRAGQLAFFEWMPRLRLREELMRVYGSIPPRAATPSCSCSTRARTATTSRAATS